MSGERMGISHEISDDDDSFEIPVTNENTITITSSEDDIAEITSDDDYDPTYSHTRQQDKKKKSILEQRNKLINHLFNSNSKTNVTAPKPSTSSFKADNFSATEIVNKTTEHILPVGGVKINFPVKPYGCQVALMFKVITGINKKENCLLESPTGSGKTLALLCGALAWQHQEYERQNELQTQQYMAEYSELDTHSESIDSSPNEDSQKISFNKIVFGTKSIYDECPTKTKRNVDPGAKRQELDSSDSSLDNNLVKIHKRRRISRSESDNSSKPTTMQPSTPEKKIQGEQADTPRTDRVPKIYYGARTHKQLQQVIKEFGRTAYCGQVKMSVLSSRDYSCIREFDKSLYRTKNDMCKECVPKKTEGRRPSDITQCTYFDNKTALRHEDLPDAFDLEDLVLAGQHLKACPYYAARTMAQNADIVFCPYNYLIDPSIRNTMSIDLTDEIVILDEAHNIEDICRDAATFTITQDQIRAALSELEHLTQYSYSNQDIMADVMYIVRALNNWNDWFQNQAQFVSRLQNGEAIHTWEVEFFAETLKNHNIGQEQSLDFSRSADKFCKKLQEDASSLFGVSQATGTLVECISSMLTYLFGNNCKLMEEFRPVLVRNVYGGQEQLTNSGGWRSAYNTQREPKDVLSLRLLCMSPAVVFATLREARCIILSSGTLAPLVSLYSELGAQFPLKVSPNHVVPPDRVWVGTLNTCPDGSLLECTMRGTDRVTTLDALGRTVLWVSSVTPHGVLCFLPSYALLNKLINRWRDTGLWQELSEIKHVFQESRNIQDHNDIMEEYYERVASKRGAILFAVYRGKVSEGMDFKDHQARAVITIGIPYPNTYDKAISEKMRYNDKHTRDKGLLTSSEWLRVQAYRALNQAVGRCVRHRGDWGAVLMCDSRFTSNYYTEHLAHWLRNFLGNNHHTFDSLVNSPNSLSSFMKNMTIMEQIDS